MMQDDLPVSATFAVPSFSSSNPVPQTTVSTHILLMHTFGLKSGSVKIWSEPSRNKTKSKTISEEEEGLKKN